MSTPLPAAMRDFLLAHHVVGLATLWQGEPWAASCFYAFDMDEIALIVLSDPGTRHGEAMLAHARVAGTIAAQPAAVTDIRGIQFTADVGLLAGDESDAARARYCQRHPIARLMGGEVWRLRLLTIKYTDNAHLLGSKTHWQRAP